MSKSETIDTILDEIVSDRSAPRVQSRVVNGEKLWFKKCSNSNISAGRIAHRLASFVIHRGFFKATPLYAPAKVLTLEISKLRSFLDAGFHTVEIVTHGNNILVTRDAGVTLEHEILNLKSDNPKDSDALLCEWASEFGKIHAKSLCHGRPHLRDVVHIEGKWVFLDFEEHPENVMPLEMAQARDLLLIFHSLSRRMNDRENLQAALDAYCENAPQAVLTAMRQALRDLRPIIAFARLLSKLRAGRDIDRFLAATDFLKQNLEFK